MLDESADALLTNMATTMRERNKEQSIRLNYGSLYTIIEQLLREKFIAVREVLKEGKRPEKTVYDLTPEGETELTRLDARTGEFPGEGISAV